MKKTLIFGFLASFLIVHQATAENYLFPTDVLDEGKLDIEAGISKSTHSRIMEVGGLPGLNARAKEEFETVEESVAVRYGLGNGWHMGAALPYDSVSSREIRDIPGGNLHFKNTNINYNKNRNLELWVKRSLIEEGQTPLSLSGALRVSANTANQSTTGLEAELAAGWRWNDGLRGFAGYRVSTADHDDVSTVNTIYAGVYKKISERLMLVPNAGYSRFSSAGIYSSSSSCSLGISAQWEVADNSYLIPAFAYSHRDDYKEGNFLIHNESNDGQTFRLSFYHVF